jgi:hypothetical protein
MITISGARPSAVRFVTYPHWTWAHISFGGPFGEISLRVEKDEAGKRLLCQLDNAILLFKEWARRQLQCDIETQNIENKCDGGHYPDRYLGPVDIHVSGAIEIQFDTIVDAYPMIKVKWDNGVLLLVIYEMDSVPKLLLALKDALSAMRTWMESSDEKCVVDSEKH